MTEEKDPQDLFLTELPNYSDDYLVVMLQMIADELFQRRFDAEPHSRIGQNKDQSD